MKVFLSYCFL